MDKVTHEVRFCFGSKMLLPTIVPGWITHVQPPKVLSAVPDPGRMTAFELDGLMPWNAMLQEAIRSYRKTKDD